MNGGNQRPGRQRARQRDHRPVIGLSTYIAEASWGLWRAEAVLLTRTYVDAMINAGAVPVLLPPYAGVIEAVLPRLDGLLIAGGPDVQPSRYGQTPGPHTQPPRPERDDAETALFSAAMDAEMPVLGVCRGMQLINVIRGGTLVQHLPDLVGHEGHAPGGGVFGRHDVRVLPGTRLAALLHTPDGVPRLEIEVATSHHQGVDRLGRDLVPTAWSSDGVIEAIEDPNLPFCLGVQWHPEQDADPALFEALVAAAAAHGAARDEVDRGGAMVPAQP